MTNSDDISLLRDESVQNLFGLLGEKWTLLILAAIIEQGNVRFTELERLTNGISQRMLSARLKNLEKHGFINRQMYQEIPVRVNYSLSERGFVLAKAFHLFVSAIASCELDSFAINND